MSGYSQDGTRLPPLVPRDGLFEGQVAIEGETRIAGTVHGTLRGPGSLALEPGSRIEGVIDCERLECRGSIIGPIKARHAHLALGTHLEGDLEAEAITVDDDAIWTGNARVGR